MQIIATGAHLSPEFGLTYQLIEKDGFTISDKVEMLMSSDTPTGIAKTMGVCMISIADSFKRLTPDLIVFWEIDMKCCLLSLLPQYLKFL
nr:UDP-N-acetylglucosamine 2-epimerase [Sphingobacterium daejeonense]